MVYCTPIAPITIVLGKKAKAKPSSQSAWQSLWEELIEREGGDTIAAMIAEPVMGAGGVIVPPAGYFEAIQPILKQHDIMLIADEVITGFGRTGEWFGSSATTWSRTQFPSPSNSLLPIRHLEP